LVWLPPVARLTTLRLSDSANRPSASDRHRGVQCFGP
jgi:hypothetical protein